MVAFHYPPCVGSSGVLRTLKFSRYLPEYGWQPMVLTANSRAYAQTAPAQLGEIPASVVVKRAFALNSGRHLAIRGRSLRVMALPDRWVSWTLGAVPAGLRLIRRHRRAMLWSTYPIATAHLIGLILHRLTGRPWVADFRDSMTEEAYPAHPLTRRTYLAIERAAVDHAASLVFTAQSTLAMHLKRYPQLDPSRCHVIANGYDEADFVGLDDARGGAPTGGRPLRLLHAGLVYPEERDPRPLFRALARLKREGRVTAGMLSVELRASGSEAEYARLLAQLAVDDVVNLLPALPYTEILREGFQADALLLLQGASCNHQIPAKLYEYLRLRKPILALTDARGDTAEVLARTGGATVIDIADEEALYRGLPGFLETLRAGRHPLPAEDRTVAYARHSQAGVLAACLDDLFASRQARCELPLTRGRE
jgi:glycosyltransferase involved in cell wall biosynthesis